MDNNSEVAYSVFAIRTWLRNINIDYLKLLAEVLGISIPATRKKEMLVSKLVETKPEDISKMLDEAKLIESGFTTDHLKKVLVNVMNIPVEEVKSIKGKRNLILYTVIYLYKNNEW